MTKKLFGLIIIAIAVFAGISIDTALARDEFASIQGYNGLYNVASGKGVIVAVIDSGVWQNHPDLKRVNWFNEKEVKQNGIDDDNNGYIDDYYGWNFIDNNSDVSPKTSHGTNVAGIIAAEKDNDIGVAGIAPDAKIMNLVVCNSEGICPRKGTVSAIKYAVDNGARVINLSLGGQGYVGYSNEYDEAIKYAYSHGVVLVASAGNGDIDSNEEIGQDLDFIKASPACNDVDNINMVIGVGATKNGSTIRTNWTNYSNKYVDVFANGEDLVSTSVPAFSLINDEYARFLTGTSFAAPIVSASAALLIEKKPSAKVYEIINMIKQTNPFSINELLLNTPYTLQCKIKNTNKEVNNGDYILFEAQNLKSDINLTFKNNNNGNLKKLSGSDFEILDATKIRINTGNLSLSSGSYSILSDNCSIDGSITIKGEKIKEDKGSNCTLANIRQCDRKGLINLLTQILNSRKAM